jgi:hypothetical protein
MDKEDEFTEVVFKEHGLTSVEVKDNGKGIDESDWPAIGILPFPLSFEHTTQIYFMIISIETSYVKNNDLLRS